ncbi:hypothetical protein LTR22_000586 [Elasticomyces elasticus]|nr:hypothetical protein LTR22_000586 [Elasticomyces elasticus]KAK4905135.1 hypothetical protein LTR49_025519 [Elasticomyces elasticus]
MLITRSPVACLSFLLIFISHATSVVIPDTQPTSNAQRVVDLAQNVEHPRPEQTGVAPNLNFDGTYAIPQHAVNGYVRKHAVSVKRDTFKYGSSVAGGPHYPTGILGYEKIAKDLLDIVVDLAPEYAGRAIDETAAVSQYDVGYERYNNLQTVHDYTMLYHNEWKWTLPHGPSPGVLTNYTNDLMFSMERLSFSPYQIRRLDPSYDTLAFPLPKSLAMNLTGSTLQALLDEGRLFYADYRDQAELAPTATYSANCDAYFYIDKKSGDFLPLAIRTNTGSNLVYTPADSADDWFLAKLMYNVNDFWFAQWDHYARTHEVAQIAYMAAIRSLSEEHPIMGWLNRVYYEIFAIAPLAQQVLFDKGSAVDLMFAHTGQSAKDYCTSRYEGEQGRFQANYFKTDLRSRGLVDGYGPALKHFPFYEDASRLHDAVSTFMQSFVDSYYSSDDDVMADKELQAWAKEANGDAGVHDFPEEFSSKQTLIDALTHMVHLVSISHHTVNTNELLSVSSTLPFHPSALYHPIPTSKGVKDVAKFLPPFQKVREQVCRALKIISIAN